MEALAAASKWLELQFVLVAARKVKELGSDGASLPPGLVARCVYALEVSTAMALPLSCNVADLRVAIVLLPLCSQTLNGPKAFNCLHTLLTAALQLVGSDRTCPAPRRAHMHFMTAFDCG